MKRSSRKRLHCEKENTVASLHTNTVTDTTAEQVTGLSNSLTEAEPWSQFRILKTALTFPHSHN